MKRFCHKKLNVEGLGELKCLRLQRHDGEHSHRQDPEEPPLAQQLHILEIAERHPDTHLWSWIWTFSSGGWMTWMVDAGLLTEEPQERSYTSEKEFTYGGFSWSGLSPSNRITEKGRALLAYHAPVEW